MPLARVYSYAAHMMIQALTSTRASVTGRGRIIAWHTRGLWCAPQVVAVKLGQGHSHTGMCLAALPCSSADLPANQPCTQPKQFIVVASYLEGEDASGLERLQGLLSFFEVCVTVAGMSERPAGCAFAPLPFREWRCLARHAPSEGTRLHTQGIAHVGPPWILCVCWWRVHVFVSAVQSN